MIDVIVCILTYRIHAYVEEEATGHFDPHRAPVVTHERRQCSTHALLPDRAIIVVSATVSATETRAREKKNETGHSHATSTPSEGKSGEYVKNEA